MKENDTLAISQSQPLPQVSARWLKGAAYAAVYIGWGTTYLAIRVGVQSLSPAGFLALRFLAAAVVLLPWLLSKRLFRGLSFQSVMHSSLQGLLLLVAGLLPTAYAEKTLPSSVAAIVVGCAPVGFAIFDRVLNGTPIRRSTCIGFVFGIAGVFLLALRGTSNASIGSKLDLIGIALVTFGCTMWSFASVVSRKMKPAQPAILNVWIQYVAAGLGLLAIAVVAEGFGPAAVARFDASGWMSLAYITLFPSLISYTAYIWLLRNEPSARVSTYAFVNPVVALFTGVLILGESASVSVVGALALVIAGTFFQFRGK